MITLRRLAIFSFLALLTGCSLMSYDKKPVCPPPGTASLEKLNKETCFYWLEITAVKDKDQGLVRGKVAQSLLKYNDEHGYNGIMWRNVAFLSKSDPTKYPSFEYDFRVVAFGESKITVGNEYHFVNEPKTKDLKQCKQSRCAEYSPPKS